jgi:hypothetical protein
MDLPLLHSIRFPILPVHIVKRLAASSRQFFFIIEAIQEPAFSGGNRSAHPVDVVTALARKVAEGRQRSLELYRGAIIFSI